LREFDEAFDRAGISVRFVVMGTAEEAASFCARFARGAQCIGDPEKRSYKAIGLGDFSLLRLFSDTGLRRRRAENRAAGFRQDWGATKLRNAAQLPGAAFIDKEGIIRWIYRGKHPGDLPPMKEMLAASQ
jgi:hypothetical protein